MGGLSSTWGHGDVQGCVAKSCVWVYGHVLAGLYVDLSGSSCHTRSHVDL